jgi:hypothetical protein
VINYKYIEDNIISCEADDLPENMVGAAIVNNPDGTQHAAIFIRYNSESKLFHFTGKSVMIQDFFNPDEIYFHKIFDIIDPILLPAFLAQCELILEKAQPRFGYFYEGALYDQAGDFISPTTSPEYMTCVGFCLNVIKGFLSDQDYFSYIDWDSSTLDETYVEQFLERVKQENPDIEINDFKANLRRILPLEYLSGAFSSEIPVTKTFIDGIKTDVINAYNSKQVA